MRRHFDTSRSRLRILANPSDTKRAPLSMPMVGPGLAPAARLGSPCGVACPLLAIPQRPTQGSTLRAPRAAGGGRIWGLSPLGGKVRGVPMSGNPSSVSVRKSAPSNGSTMLSSPSSCGGRICRAGRLLNQTRSHEQKLECPLQSVVGTARLSQRTRVVAIVLQMVIASGPSRPVHVTIPNASPRLEAAINR